MHCTCVHGGIRLELTYPLRDASLIESDHSEDVIKEKEHLSVYLAVKPETTIMAGPSWYPQWCRRGGFILKVTKHCTIGLKICWTEANVCLTMYT